MMLELRGITKTYRTADSGGDPGRDTGKLLEVLHIQSLTVHEKERIALIGPSGSGKSTLLNIIAGIIRPTTGSLRLYGEELTDLDEKQWDRLRTESIGYIFQNFYLLPGFSALENVLIAMQFAGILRGKAREERAKELLMRVGLEGRMHHKPHQLSNGEQQRVAIARALANQPKLVLADEPTANLDAANALAIIQLLSEICSEQGAALILSTHDVQLVPYMDRTVQLEGGRYIEESRDCRGSRVSGDNRSSGESRLVAGYSEGMMEGSGDVIG